MPWTSGVTHIGAILTVTGGAQGASASQLFASPVAGRRAVTITNCESASGTYLYIGHSNAVSATAFRIRLDAGESVTIPAGPGCDVWIYGTAGNTDYAAYEESWLTS